MNRFRAALWILLAWLMSVVPAGAHIGSPNVFFDGEAGPYPVRVVIRPPGVIPGLADISVRVHTNGVQRVQVLPIRWDSGKEGAPRPDTAELISGETNLYTAQLWFMRGGAQSVEIEVIGDAGRGRVMVPVNAVATRVLELPRELKLVLGALGALLVALAASIFGGAVRESVLPMGEAASRRRIWLGRAATAIALLVIVGALRFGAGWWEREANDYRRNRLFKPVETDAEFDAGKLRVKFAVDLLRRNGPLVPDHGKLMHLFLVREPLMDAFAHLHPANINWNTFELEVPPLPAGEYQLYGDVTYESGFSDTLTTRVSVPAADHASSLQPDDAWVQHAPFPSALNASEANLSRRWFVTRRDSGPLIENREIDLSFVVRDAKGGAATLEPYMGMAAHLIVRREDGAVFTHLHPSGTFSMAAKQLFDLRAEGKAQLRVAPYTNDPLCRLPPAASTAAGGARNEVTFPYAFPKPGKYRLWLQMKIAGEVQTGVFDVEVAPKAKQARFL